MEPRAINARRILHQNDYEVSDFAELGRNCLQFKWCHQRESPGHTAWKRPNKTGFEQSSNTATRVAHAPRRFGITMAIVEPLMLTESTLVGVDQAKKKMPPVEGPTSTGILFRVSLANLPKNVILSIMTNSHNIIFTRMPKQPQRLSILRGGNSRLHEMLHEVARVNINSASMLWVETESKNGIARLHMLQYAGRSLFPMSIT